MQAIGRERGAGTWALGNRSILGDPRRADLRDIYQIRAEKRPLIPAVTHVDGSGRLQTVYAHTNEPVVCKPEALDCFLRTKMDVRVPGDWVVRRVDSLPSR